MQKVNFVYLLRYIYLYANSVKSPNPFNMSKEEEILVDLEVQNLLAKGAMEICSPDPNQFISNIFTIPKKDGGEKASGRHARTESVCRVSSIQDGGYITAERYPPERGLYDKAGSSRCLLDYSSRSKIKDLSKIFLEGHTLSVHMFTILPLTISKVVHQDTKASNCLSKIYGDSSANLLRRHPHNGRFFRSELQSTQK